VAVPMQPQRPAGSPPPRGIVPGQSIVPVKAGNAVASNTVMASPTGVSARTNIRPTLHPKREKILLLGDTVSGKSYAYMRLAAQEYQDAIDHGRKSKRFFVLDTDDTMPSFLNAGDEFDYLYCENGGNVYPYPAASWDELRDAYATIRAQAEPGDWIVFDLASRIYEMAQVLVARVKGIDLNDSTIQRAIDGKGFGGFDASAWTLVTTTFESIVKDAILNTRANILCLQHITEIIDVAGREGKREQMTLFDAIGLKPQGAPRLAGLVDTIVMVWAIRQVNRGERGVRTSAKTVRTLAVMKDRGRDLFIKAEYDRDVFIMLNELRREHIKGSSTNVVDPTETAKIKESVEAALNPPDLTANTGTPASSTDSGS